MAKLQLEQMVTAERRALLALGRQLITFPELGELGGFAAWPHFRCYGPPQGSDRTLVYVVDDELETVEIGLLIDAPLGPLRVAHG